MTVMNFYFLFYVKLISYVVKIKKLWWDSNPRKSQINAYSFILVIALKTHSITKRQRKIKNSRITENNMLIQRSRLTR